MPAGPEIRNPKAEIRNKSELMEMGNWKNGQPQNFFASCEQFRLLQRTRRTHSKHPGVLALTLKQQLKPRISRITPIAKDLCEESRLPTG